MFADALRFIRFSHTIFALPFALGAMVVAAGGLPGGQVAALVLLAMVLARTAAMLFNRIADWNIDKRNPRTEGRHRLLPRAVAKALMMLTAACFVLVTWFINPLCFFLSPLALGIIFLYSLTKRFTHFSHIFLGLALSVAPVGAWLAVRGRFDFPPLILALGVLFWVAGFDIIYATQDHDFDRREGLHSLVVKFGIQRSLSIAAAFHWLMLATLVGFGLAAGLGRIYFGSLFLIVGTLVFEQRSARQLDLQGINRAFFQSNAFVSLVFAAAVFLDVVLRAA